MYIKWNKRGVRVGFALIGGVCVSLPLLKCSAVRASATELESITLSPQQALALYGTTITANYWNGYNYEDVVLQYVGDTTNLVSLNGYPTDAGDVSYVQFWGMRDPYGYMTKEKFESTPFLIYRWDVNSIANAPNVDFSLRFQHSVDITTYGFQTSVFWSRTTQSVYPGVNGALGYYASSYTLYGLSDIDIVGTSYYLERPNLTQEYGVMRTQVCPCLVGGSQIAPDEYLYYFGDSTSATYLGVGAFAGSHETGSTAVTIGSSEIRIKMERPITQATFYNLDTGEFSSYTTPAVYILLQCPTLYGDYILPPNDNTPDYERILDNITGILNDNNGFLGNISEESTVQTRQLIAILQKLEQIYQKIPSVDLSVPTLSTAPNIPIDSDIDSRIMDDLDSYEMPDIDESLDLEKISSFSEFIMSYTRIIPVEVIGASAFLLFFSFVMWIIFRGRGS